MRPSAQVVRQHPDFRLDQAWRADAASARPPSPHAIQSSRAITALLFVFYYVMFFIVHEGPCVRPHWANRCCGRCAAAIWTSPATGHLFSLYLYLMCGAAGGEPDRCGTVHHSHIHSLELEGWRGLGALFWFMRSVDRHGRAGRRSSAGQLAARWRSAGRSGWAISIVLVRTGRIPLEFRRGCCRCSK